MSISSKATGLKPGVCTSTTRPTTPYEGMMIYETDTDLTYVWGGSAWQQVSGGTAVGNSGLVYVTQSTFSASSVAIDSCFTSTYANYRIVVNVTAGAGGAAQIQLGMRIGGVTTTGTSYFSYYAGITWAGGADNTANNGGGNWFALRTNGDSLGFAGVLDMQDPQAASRTRFTSVGTDSSQRWYAGGYHNSTTQFDGFALSNSGASSMTGTVRVYGYRQS